MANSIPKIRWKVVTTGCTTTSESTTLSGIANASDLLDGQTVEGTGIPSGTTVSNIDTGLGTAVLSNPATASGSGVSLDFYFEILFDYPPDGPENENETRTATVTTSLSGKRQTVRNYREFKRTPSFKMLTQTIVDQLTDWYELSASLGETFRYYEDSDVDQYVEYEIDQDDFATQRTSWNGSGYLYSVDLSFRRVA